MSFDQLTSWFFVGALAEEFKLGEVTTDALSERIILRHFLDFAVIEFIPLVFHGRLDEGVVMSSIDGTSMDKDWM